jgi:hypothetical protein
VFQPRAWLSSAGKYRPGAVPKGLSMTLAPRGTIACLRFEADIVRLRLAKKASRWDLMPSFNSSGSPSSSAMDSRVRSSFVGPSPPETRTTSEREAASAMASLITAPSETTRWRETMRPRAAICCPSQAALVLMVSPRRSSSPVLTSSMRMRQKEVGILFPLLLLRLQCHQKNNLCLRDLPATS